jgi:branched-chain amino acid transport system permease protein
MSFFLQILFSSLMAGALYSLVASAFSLIYSTCKVSHFAHGGVITTSAYFFYFFLSILHINIVICILLTLIFASVIGLLINQIAYKPLRKRKANGLIIFLSSFTLLILLESIVIILFGQEVRRIEYIKVIRGIEFLGAIITPLQIIIFIISIIILIIFLILIKKTKIGKTIRAVSENKDVAEIVGISAEKIYTKSMIIGSVLAGVTSVLVGLEGTIYPSMGTNLMIKGFAGSVVGGIKSIPGAILGSFLLGFAENFGIIYLPSSYKSAITFFILFIFLIFKTDGILGIKKQL